MFYVPVVILNNGHFITAVHRNCWGSYDSNYINKNISRFIILSALDLVRTGVCNGEKFAQLEMFAYTGHSKLERRLVMTSFFFFIKFCFYYQYIFCTWYIDMYTSAYAFFTLCIEFHVVRVQTKVCLNCPHHKKGGV